MVSKFEKSKCQFVLIILICSNVKKINILSIDGGGIRAFIPLFFLFEMEIAFKKNICTMFDLVGGSGFGGLVATALNVSSHVNENKPKYTPVDLMNFLQKNASIIFKEKYQMETIYGTLTKLRRQYADKYGGTIYNGDGLQKCL